MRTSRSRLHAGLSLAAALPLVAGALVLGAPSANATAGPAGRAALHGTKPLWATQRADRGRTAKSSKVTARVYLAGRDAAGLAQLAQQVSDPASAQFQHYISPASAEARFGATKQQIADVRAWLTSSGVKVTGSNRHYLTATGSTAAMEKAFSTQFHNYSKGGKTYRAPEATASVPESLHGAVLTVTGLDNAPRQADHDATELPPPPAAAVTTGPFSAYFGENVNKQLPSAYGSKAPYAIHGYTGTQLRAVYGAQKYTGKGVTVAIVDAFASPTLDSDTATYAKRNGDVKYKSGQLTQVLPSSYNSIEACDAAGWYGEETLDVEAVHGLAPAAGITYVGAASCNDDDLMDALNKIVDNHLADIVSDSWGGLEDDETPSLAAAYDQIFQTGAVEGIGFNFSSGDSGDNVTAQHPTKSVGTPANSAWVTAVGGTTLALGKKDNYLFETGWGTDLAPLSADGKNWTGLPGTFQSGGGGGTSALIAQPFYQRAVVPTSLSDANAATPMRVLPDISAVGDPGTGFLVGQTQLQTNGVEAYSEYRIGGTSLSSPVFAGVQAMAQEAQGGVPLGFANPGIYQRYGTPELHDVTDHPLGAGQNIAIVRNDLAADGTIGTSLRTFGHDSSLSAVVGFDDVTGVGSPTPDYVKSFKR